MGEHPSGGAEKGNDSGQGTEPRFSKKEVIFKRAKRQGKKKVKISRNSKKQNRKDPKKKMLVEEPARGTRQHHSNKNWGG